VVNLPTKMQILDLSGIAWPDPAPRATARDEKLKAMLPGIIRAWEAGRPFPTDGDRRAQADSYRLSSLIHSCVSERASAVAQATMVVEKDGQVMSPKDDLLAEMMATPYPALDQPGQGLTHSGFLKRVEGNVWTFGEAIAFKRRSAANVMRQIVPMRPDMTEMLIRDDGSIDKYMYGPDVNTAKPLDPKNIIHIKRHNPLNDYRGLAPSVTLGREGRLDSDSILYLVEIFGNGGIPSAYLSLIEDVDDPTATRYQKRFKEKYGRRWGHVGGTGYGELAVFGHSGKLEKFGLDPSNMDLTNVFRVAESRICAVHQTPALLVGASVGAEHSAAYGHLRETRWSWWFEHVIAELIWLAEELTLQVASEFGPQYRIRADISRVPALEGARSAVWGDAGKAFDRSLLSRNQALEKMGYPPADELPVYADELRGRVLAFPPATGADDPAVADYLRARDVAAKRAFDEVYEPGQALDAVRCLELEQQYRLEEAERLAAGRAA